MTGMKVRASRVSKCGGCEIHNASCCGVRPCLRCAEPCWVDRLGMRLVIELGSPVYCDECAEKPNGIIVVSEQNFSRAIDEAKRFRDARRRTLAMN